MDLTDPGMDEYPGTYNIVINLKKADQASYKLKIRNEIESIFSMRSRKNYEDQNDN
jgi:hypothetical protein